MALATLTVDLNARLVNFEEQLKRANDLSRQHTNSIKEQFEGARKVIGALFAEEIVRRGVEAFKNLAESMEELGKASQRTGIAVENLSALQFGAKLADVEFDELSKGLQHLNKNIDDGSDSFRRLGVDLKQFKSPDEVLQAVAKRFAAIEDGAGKAAIAQDLFGKAGAHMIPFLNQLGTSLADGTSGFDAFKKEAESLGLIVSEKSAKAAEEFNDNLKRLGQAARGAGIAILSDALPALTRFSEELLKGRELFGSFSAALFQIGVGINPFNSQIENIRKLRDEIDELTAARERAQRIPVIGTSDQDFNNQIEVAKKKLEFVQFQQRAVIKQNLARFGPGELSDARDLALNAPTAKEKAPPQIEKGLSAQAKALLDAQIAAEKQAAALRTDILDRYHERGLVSEQAFADARLAISKAALSAELSAVNAAIGKQQELITTSPTAEQGPLKAELIRLQSQRSLLVGQGRADEIKSREALTDAEQKFSDAIGETNARLLEQQGELAQAAAIRLDQANRVPLGQIRANLGPDSNAERRLKQTTDLTLAEKQFQEQQAKGSIIQQALADQEQAIQAAVADGRLKEIDAIDKIDKARRASIPALQEVAHQEDLIAQKANIPTLSAAAATAKTSVDSLAASLSIAQQKFAAIQNDASIAQTELGTNELNIQTQLAQGRLSELDALKRTDETRKASIPTLEAIAARLDEVAQKQNDPALLAGARRFHAELEATKASADQLAEKFRGAFKDAFADPFANFITGASSAKQALADFGKNLEQFFARLATQNIAEQLFGKQSGGGSLIGDLANKFFGSGGGGAGGAAVGTLSGFATGGSFVIGGAPGTDRNLVAFRGTRGERVTVTPEGQNPNAGGGHSISINVNVGGSGDPESMRRGGAIVATQVARQLQRALARS